MEMKKEIIEWKMIRPDGSERILHIGKNEVNNRELDFLSKNSLILFEIYFSPDLKAYLRFYGYVPLRLNFEKTGENSKHIYIDNNQSFVFLEQLENTTIDVYDKDEFVTFSFQKNIKKPENNKDIIEKNKRMKWLNENIEYEDLKKEENEYGNKSLYSKDFFNYNKKNIKKDEEQSDKSEDIMSKFSKDKSEIIKSSEENINKDKNKDEENISEKEKVSINKKSNESEAEINSEEKSKSHSENNIIQKEEKEEDNENQSKEKSKSMEIEENENQIENKSSNKKSSISGSIEKESHKSKKSLEKNKSSEQKSNSSNIAPISNLTSKKYEEEEKKESEDKTKDKLLNYDRILDNFVLFNSDSESKEESSENEDEEFSEKSENSKIKYNNPIQRESSLNKKDKININTSLQTKCTICLDQMTNPATLKPCGHQFCKECIGKWLQKSSACPDCKKNAKKLYFFSLKNGRYMGKKIKRKKYKAEKQNVEEWFLNCDKNCLICGKEDNTAYLLVCDSCNFRICHTFCVGLDSIPDTEWHCPECEAKEKGQTFSLTKNNLKKFIEKEKKILKVKQSEVKGNNNIKKEEKNNKEDKKKLNKEKKSVEKEKEKQKQNQKPEITVMSLRNRSSDKNNKSKDNKVIENNKNK